MSKVVHLDFETFSHISLKACGAYRYAQDVSTECLIACYAVDNGPVQTWLPYKQLPPASLVAAAKAADDTVFTAHNAEFERQIYTHVLRKRYKDLPPLPPARWRCTAVRAAASGLPRSLDGALKAIGSQIRKDPKGKRLLTIFSQLRKPTKKNPSTRTLPSDLPESFQELIEYCRQDVVSERELDRILPDVLPWEWSNYHYTMLVNDRGLPIDIPSVHKTARVISVLEKENLARVAVLTNGLRPTQRDKVLVWLKESGVDVENLQLKTIDKMLKGTIKQKNVREILELRLEASKASTKKVAAMANVACVNQRACGTMLFYGAHCVQGEVEVLTKQGWKAIKDWTGGEIAQVDEFQTIAFLSASRYEGPVVHQWLKVDAPYLKASFTFGHTFPYLKHGTKKWSTLTAYEASQRVARINVPVGGDLLSNGKLTPAQMRVLVMVQADGHWQLKDGRELRFGLTKLRKIKRARQLLVAAKVAFRECRFKSHPKEITFRIRWADLPKWLTPDKKVFGSWLFDSSHDARIAFTSELQHWDGHVQGNQVAYSSTVLANVEWVSTICHLTGLSSAFNLRKIVRGNRKPEYRLTIRDRSHTELHPKHYSKVYKPAIAYCAETKTGFWLARGNGHIFVTGNTGRLAGKLIQPHNFTRGLLEPEQQDIVLRAFASGSHELVKLLYEKPMHMLSQSMRGFIRAPHGTRFLIADYSMIETRVLAWLANEVKLLSIYHRNLGLPKEKQIDVYKLMAMLLYHVEYTEVTKEQRRIGKNLRLGAGYQLGVDGLLANCEKEEIEMEREFAEQAISAYREDNPNIEHLWYDTEAAALGAMTGKPTQLQGKVQFERWRKWFVITLPSGRKLRYFDARVETVVRRGRARQQLRYFSERRTKPKDAGWQTVVEETPDSQNRVSTYGGKLVENIVQAIAFDLMIYGMRKAELIGYPSLASIHDEIITLRSHGQGNIKELERVICTLPSWANGIPLVAEGFETERYRKG